MSLPSSLDFGFEPARVRASRTFSIVNSGDIDVEFEWTIQTPFTLEPTSGTLRSGDTAKITCHFDPEVFA